MWVVKQYYVHNPKYKSNSFCVLSDMQKANVALLALHLTCLLYIFILHVSES